MTSIRITQGALVGETNRSLESIVAGGEVTVENLSPGAANAIVLLWRPPDDDTAAFTPDGDDWKITPKAGVWGRYEFKVTVDGVELRKTFTVLSPVLTLPDFAANERADPDASLQQMGATEIEASSTNEAFGPFATGSAFGWWRAIRRLIEKLEALFHSSTGHDHSGAGENGPATAHESDTANPHAVSAAQAGADPAGSAAAVQTNLTTHEGDATNPHSVTAGQAGAYTQAEVNVLVDATMKAPEAFAASGTYPVTYDGAAVEKGDSFRMTAAGTMGAVTVNIEDLLIALVDTPAQVDANWMVAESNRDQATETVKGVAELATQAEADAGTDDQRIITPLKLENYSKLTSSLQSIVAGPTAFPLVIGKAYVFSIGAADTADFPAGASHGDRIGMWLLGGPTMKITLTAAGADQVQAPEPFLGAAASSIDLVNFGYFEFVAIVGAGPPITWLCEYWAAGAQKVTSPGVVGLEGGRLTYRNIAAAYSLLVRQNADTLESIALAPNSIAAKVGSADIAGLTLANNQIIVRDGGDLKIITLASNSILMRGAADLIVQTFAANTLLGRGPTGALVTLGGLTALRVLDPGLTEQGLSDGATITFDVNSGRNANVQIAGNRNFDIVNTVNGQSGFFNILQGAGAPWGLTWKRGGSAAGVVFEGGVAPVLTGAVGARDIIRWYDDGSRTHVTAHSLDSK